MASERQFGETRKNNQVDSFFAWNTRIQPTKNDGGWGWEEEEDDDAGDGGEFDGDIDDGCNR